jgi:hypothetical protein
LTALNCPNCPLLTLIPLLPNLTRLNCSNCPLLTTIPNHRYEYLNKTGCPWLDQTNIPKLVTLQTFVRKNLKYFRFKHWCKSREGIVWIYDPTHLGGWYAKKQLEKMINKM